MNFWWSLRRVWHRPQMMRSAAYENFLLPYLFHDDMFPEDGVRFFRLLGSRDGRRVVRQFARHDLHHLPRRITRLLWIAWSYGPLACNGDDRGRDWSRRVCEWLEERARKKDRKFDP